MIQPCCEDYLIWWKQLYLHYKLQFCYLYVTKKLWERCGFYYVGCWQKHMKALNKGHIMKRRQRISYITNISRQTTSKQHHSKLEHEPSWQAALYVKVTYLWSFQNSCERKYWWWLVIFFFSTFHIIECWWKHRYSRTFWLTFQDTQ